MNMNMNNTMLVNVCPMCRQTCNKLRCDCGNTQIIKCVPLENARNILVDELDKKPVKVFGIKDYIDCELIKSSGVA